MPAINQDESSNRAQGGGDKDKPKVDPEYEHTTPHENQPERSVSKR